MTRAIAKENVCIYPGREKPNSLESGNKEVLGNIGRRTNCTPASQYWDTYTDLCPGHFYSNDLLKGRADLLREGICPQVRLSGTGAIKGLRYTDCVVHSWPQEAHVCLKFIEEYGKSRYLQ